MNEDNLTGTLNHFFRRKPRIPLASNEGIVTATDAAYFVGFQILYSSLVMRHTCKVVVFDLGMEKRQKSWCARQENLIVMDGVADKLRTQLTLRSPKWQKPYFLYASPFEKSLWLDADTIVTDDLDKLFDNLDKEPVIFNGLEEIPANNSFFLRMPEKVDVPYYAYYPNTSAIAINRDRDFWILRDWIWATEQVEADQRIFEASRYYSGNTLGWCLARNERLGLPQQNMVWNWPAQFGQFPNKPLVYGSPHELLASIKKDFPLARIVHFNTPKPWILWDHRGLLDIEPHH